MELETPGKARIHCSGHLRQLPTPPQLTVATFLSPADKESSPQFFPKAETFACQSHSGSSVDSQLGPAPFSSLGTFSTQAQLVMHTAPANISATGEQAGRHKGDAWYIPVDIS